MSLNQLPSASAQAHIGREHYQTTITSSGHTLIADEPAASMGTDLGMAPYSLLLASLGSCTAITLRMYADRKMWVVDSISVKLDLYRINNETIIERQVTLTGNLSDEQRNRMLTIANSCPVHQLLTGKIDIKTSMAGA